MEMKTVPDSSSSSSSSSSRWPFYGIYSLIYSKLKMKTWRGREVFSACRTWCNERLQYGGTKWNPYKHQPQTDPLAFKLQINYVSSAPSIDPPNSAWHTEKSKCAFVWKVPHQQNRARLLLLLPS
jgi:hypothetical protein